MPLLFVLEVKFSFNGKEDILYPVILQYEKEMILVDCGYAGFMPLIEKAAQVHGISLQDLTGILITHHDMDHMGGLAEIKAEYPHVKIYAPATEAGYISGMKKSLRLVQAEQLYPNLPEEHKPGAMYFQEMLKSMQPVAVDYTFSEQTEPEFLPGIQIIHTPGHMPGHVSLYLPETKTLIAADAVVSQDGELEIANPQFTLDLPKAVVSVKKLQSLALEKIVCYHGGIVENDIQYKLQQLLSRYN